MVLMAVANRSISIVPCAAARIDWPGVHRLVRVRLTYLNFGDRSMVVERVISVIAQIMRIPEDQISIESSFEELGVDSLDGVEIVCELEERFGIVIPDDMARSMTSVRQVVEALKPLVDGPRVASDTASPG
jgi:acyl carrier protein